MGGGLTGQPVGPLVGTATMTVDVPPRGPYGWRGYSCVKKKMCECSGDTMTPSPIGRLKGRGA